MKSIGKKSKRVFISVSRSASMSGWKILPNNGRLLFRGASMTPIKTLLRCSNALISSAMVRNSNLDPFFGAGIKSDMSRQSGVFAVPVKPGSTENWNPRRWGELVVRRAPRFWMPNSLCKFRMFTASEGSVSLRSVAACVIFANFSRSFCTARRRGIKAFCARSWASRVAVEPVPWAPPPSLRCVTVVSGPISGL
jgi:hypothetical protein